MTYEAVHTTCGKQLAVPRSRDAAAAVGGRLAGVEVVRIAASCGIVWFHVKAPGADIGYGGLPAFMVLAVAFADLSAGLMPIRQYWVGRLRRMGVPWVFWTVVYGTAKAAHATCQGRPLSSEFHCWMLLTGTSLHLWYLPFGILVTTLIGISRARAPARVQSWAWLTYALLGSGLIMLFSWLCPRLIGMVPVGQWAFIAPAVVVGLALACIPAGEIRSLLRLGVLVALVAAAGILSARWGYSMLYVPYTVGVLACAAAWAIPGTASWPLLRVSRLALGVYLVHPLVAFALLNFWPRCGGIALAAVVCSMSCVVIALLRLTPLRFVV